MKIDMETIKQRQVGETIKRHFSIVLQQEGSYVYGSEALVTVTTVKVTPDFSLAKIYLSIFNTENKQEVLLEMEHNVSRLKQSLAFRLKKHLRRMPNINFYLDDTLDEMFRLNTVFKKLHDENQMGEGSEEGEE